MKKLCSLLLCAALLATALPGRAAAVFYADGDDITAVITPTPEQDKTDFEHRQEYLSSWVKDVNYRTRVGLTERDRRVMSAFLTVLTLGMSSFFMDSLTHGLSTRVIKISSDDIEHLKTDGRQESLSKHMPRLALDELYRRIKEKPFLLLLVGNEEYKELCAHYPKVQTLFENMYAFFYHRSIVLGEEFNKNVDNIERISRDGKGDPFRTWQLLADYTRRELESAKLEKRALQDLGYYFDRLKRDLKVDAKVRRMLRNKGVLPSKKEARRHRRQISARQKAVKIIQETPDSVLRQTYLEE